MAKKAPAKRKPNAIEQAAPQLAELGKRTAAAREEVEKGLRYPSETAKLMAAVRKDKKAPAKRKPREKKPVEVVPVVDTTDIGTPVEFPSWQSVLLQVLPCLLAFVFGAGVGIWIAGGIPIGPDNKPTPAPVPDPVKSFRVIFVKESGQTLSGEQVAIPGAKEIRDYLNAKTTQEGGQVGWREYDPQQQTVNEQTTMKSLWEKVKPSLLPAPCLIVEVNGAATVMPFPSTVAEAVATLKKAGG